MCTYVQLLHAHKSPVFPSQNIPLPCPVLFANYRDLSGYSPALVQQSHKLQPIYGKIVNKLQPIPGKIVHKLEPIPGK